MSNLDQLKAQLLPLVRAKAQLKLAQPIRLASGKMSDSYFDGRRVTLDPEAMSLFARAIIELVDLNALDAVGGPTLGADPIATGVSLIAYLEQSKKLPAFLIRKSPKEHGLGQQIEGCQLKAGMKVLVVEDVITTGGSVKRAIDVVEGTGAKVVLVTCLVDRNEGGADTLKDYQYTPLFHKDEL